MTQFVLAFDVYGTLVDTAGIDAQLGEHVGGRAAKFAQLWREKQLEYTFRRASMRNYVNFPECTRQALEYCCTALDAPIDSAARERLLSAYRALPAYTDTLSGLKELRRSGHRMFAFSNGIRADIESLLDHAQIAHYFEDIVSVDEIGTYKPSPDVYRHFLQRASASADSTWLISGNPFDAIGALAQGMRAAWVRRSPAHLFDPWEFEPTVTIATLTELRCSLDTAGSAA